MQILQKPISIPELREVATEFFEEMVKAVVDITTGRLAINAELHSDLEALLLESGSKQTDLWGINLYPDLGGDDFIEFDSMINLRPAQGNMSRGVDAPERQECIKKVVNQWISK